MALGRFQDLGPHRGLTGEDGGKPQGRGEAGMTGTEAAQRATGMETFRLAGCLFWWFGKGERGEADLGRLRPECGCDSIYLMSTAG